MVEKWKTACENPAHALHVLALFGVFLTVVNNI